jgi:hypothetical protein
VLIEKPDTDIDESDGFYGPSGLSNSSLRDDSRITTELKVSKPTLIDCSRKQQFQIHNLCAVELEALADKWLCPERPSAGPRCLCVLADFLWWSLPRLRWSALV